MDKHLKILEAVKSTGIIVNRWYCIDSFIYIHVSKITDNTKSVLNKVFRDIDYFNSYNCISIDMDKE